MKKLWESNPTLLVNSGFLYLPLYFDPSIEIELQNLPPLQEAPEGSGASPAVMAVEGSYFIKTISLESLLTNYEQIDQEDYEGLKNACLEKFTYGPEVQRLNLDPKLRALVFQVMPHFVRRKQALGRAGLSQYELLQLIGDRLNIPPDYFGKCPPALNPASFKGTMEVLESLAGEIKPLDEGFTSARAARQWLLRALTAKIAAEEAQRLKQLSHEAEKLAGIPERHLAVLRFLADRGALEIDGFGFYPIGNRKEYCIYKRTGEYVLKDYFGRLYLFPDCRVAVSTMGRSSPVVLERYKHPMLYRHRARQPICLPKNSHSPGEFSPQSVIAALEEGIATLYYGYNHRRRNGYHSLDRFDRKERTIDFDDYRIPKDHPKLLSGEVQVTNNFN